MASLELTTDVAPMALSQVTKVHLALAVGQLVVVTVVCHAADIWRSPETSEQFPGHLGPSMFIAAIGLTAFLGEWDWRRRCGVEGRLSVAAAAVYVVGEFGARLILKGWSGSATHYLKHGLHAWMCVVIGLCGVAFLLAPRLGAGNGERLARAPHCWFAVTWCWFIWAHKQPNDFGVAMHGATAAWVALGAIHRLACARPAEGGACYVFAAYTFFGGQTGLTLTAASFGADVGAYVLLWHILALSVLLLYARLFLVREGGGVPYAAVATADDGDVALV